MDHQEIMDLSQVPFNDQIIAYFCWRMAPKLIELPEFVGLLPEPSLYLCLSHCQQWKDAVINILSWEDNGTRNVSKQFEDFYNGLLYYRNVFDTFPRKHPQLDLLRLVFEIDGSNPSVLPEALNHALRICDTIPRAQDYLQRRDPELRQIAERCPFENAKRICYDFRRPPNTNGPLPMCSGLDLCGGIALTICSQRLRDIVVERCSTRVDPMILDELGQDAQTECRKDANAGPQIRLFVGPPGCGKTRKLLQSLETRWGLYLLPGNFPSLPSRSRPSPSTSALSVLHTTSNEKQPEIEDRTLFDELTYRPRRSGGSRDTQTWYDDIKAMSRNGFNCWNIAKGRMGVLLRARLFALEAFLDPGLGDASPADWCNFQTDFDDVRCDIFNDLFRIARFRYEGLAPPRSLAEIEEGKRMEDIASDLLICIDEAQCDLQDTFQGRPSHEPAGYYYETTPMSLQQSDRSQYPSAIEETGNSESGWFHPFSCIVRAAASAFSLHQSSPNFQMIISGTALQLQRTTEAIMVEIPAIRQSLQSVAALGIWWRKAPARNSDQFLDLSELKSWVSVESQFDLLQEDSQFEQLLKEMIPTCRTEIRGIITEHSKALRGRYRWSVCYLVEIDKLIKQNPGIDLQEFNKEAAQCCHRVHLAAKQGLKSRLKDIDRRSFQGTLNIHQSLPHQPYFAGVDIDLPDEILARQEQEQYREVLDELCWLAIRSDLLGKDTIFQSDESAEMVTQGFAFAETANHGVANVARRIVLKERIAVEAALEYFQAQRANGRPSRYDKALKDAFYREQNNASALGKKAELFFAWHLRKVLRAPDQHVDAILPPFSKKERTEVLDILVGNANNLSQLLRESEHGLYANTCFKTEFVWDADTMYLIEGSQTAFQEESGSGRLDTMWGWLEMVRTGCSKDSLKSTFWFPSNMAGPDVLFALRRTSIHQLSSIQSSEPSGSRKRPRESGGGSGTIDDSIVLCAVQIKRQEKNHDTPGAIRSTNPNHWFRQGSDHEARSILHELKEWRIKGHPIVRVLVTALTAPPGNDSGRKTPKQYLEEEKIKSPTMDRFKRKIRKTKQKSRERSAKDDLEDLEGSEIPLHQQYFNWVGVEHDGDLFGAAFEEFNRVEKNA